jgi:hypothetical protein
LSFVLSLVFVALAVPASATAQTSTITLPAAASIVGISPFFSDVRVFNTSYTSAVNITATYYCFLGACPGAAPQITINLASRDSQAFNDIVANAFASPNSAGGIEFTFDGDPSLIIVTSRLFSTTPNPTVGMFIPGLDLSQAHQLSVLSSVQTGDTSDSSNNGAGFRTNVGVYNPNDQPATVTFTGFANHAPVGGNVQRVVGPHSGLQLNSIFDELGGAGTNTDNGVIFVQSDLVVFSYAAVIDNNTSDPYLVLGAPDQPVTEPTVTGTPLTPTPTGTKTPTRTPGGPTATPNASASPTITPASASPLIRRTPGPGRRIGEFETPQRRPAPGPSEPSRLASLFEERYAAVLRAPRPGLGGW